MYYFKIICFVCLKHDKYLERVSHETPENEIFTQVKYALPELMILDSENPVYICSSCHTILQSFCTFKKMCLGNYSRMKSNAKILQGNNNIQDQKLRELQTITINCEPDQLIKQDSSLPSSEINEGIFSELEMEIKTEHEEENIEALLTSNEQNKQKSEVKDDIVIKEESVMSEDSIDREIYHEFVKCELLADTAQNGSPSVGASDDNIPLKNKSSTCSTYTINKVSNCPVCNKLFLLPSVLAKHMKSHSDVKEFECSVCNKKFVEKRTLKTHMKLHSDIKEFECSTCKKRFAHNSYLKKHMKHHLRKNFECIICSKKFVDSYYLNQHMKFHSSIRKFECTICDKKFLVQSNLTQHLKYHLGVKKFECTICSKKFMEKYNLNQHMKYHLGIKKHECTICDMKFVVKYDLTQHMKYHLGIKDFECLICNKKFRKRFNLKQHMKLHDR